MGTVFTVRGRRIETKFGELALCEPCLHQNADNSCDCADMPTWREGWCSLFNAGQTILIGLHTVKRIAAEAYQDGYEKCLEFVGENQREPILDESHD